LSTAICRNWYKVHKVICYHSVPGIYCLESQLLYVSVVIHCAIDKRQYRWPSTRWFGGASCLTSLTTTTPLARESKEGLFYILMTHGASRSWGRKVGLGRHWSLCQPWMTNLWIEPALKSEQSRFVRTVKLKIILACRYFLINSYSLL
jgi:hypothetical protein